MADSTIHPITDWMTGVLATCESVRLELDDPLERLLDAVASDDQYEVVPLIRECVDALMVLEESCDELASVRGKGLSSIRSDARLVRRELASLRQGLLSISKSGIDGEELRDRIEDWMETLDDCDASLSDLIEVARSDETH